jgi:hypothetical protein
MLKTPVIALLFFALLFTACKKYPESQNFTILTPKDRFARNWILKSYEKNGVTTESPVADLVTLLFKKNSTYSKTIVVGGVTAMELGRWNLSSGNANLEILPLDSTVIQETEILKLTTKEFKVREITGVSPITYTFVVQ